MTLSDAVKKAFEENPDLTIIEAVDLGDRFGFVMLELDEANQQKSPDQLKQEYFISGWTTVDKTTGSVSELSAVSFNMDHPGVRPKVLPITKLGGRR